MPYSCRLLASAFLCLALAAPSWALPRLLIVGDSWAAEQWEDGSHTRVFSALGLSGIAASGELTTTSGSTAADWVMPANLQRISDALQQYPHIDTVQLTVGGNDFLDAWNTGMTEAEFAALIGFIQHDVDIISSYILGLRPDIEIVLSLYDYPNFEDTRNGLIWTFACSALWDDLGQPSPLQVNTAAVAVIDAIEDELIANPRIQHVRQLGQAQGHFGLSGFPPGSIAPPGLLDQPSPAEAMRERFLFGGLDCFHFNAVAYDVLTANLVEDYLDARFQPGLALELVTGTKEYDGSPRTADLLSTPPVDVLVTTYDGSTEPPVDAGVYELVVTAPGWRDSLVTSFEVARAAQLVEFVAPESVLVTETVIALQASASSGLSVVLELVAGPATLDGQTVLLAGTPGTVVIRASQPGDGNWLAAETIERQIEILELNDGLFDDRFEALPAPPG